jgi:membrane protein DedA with SNARE-associated domain
MPCWRGALIATVALYAVGKVGEGLAPVLLARDWPASLALLVLNANDLHLVLTVRSCSGAGQLLAWFCVCTCRRVSEDAFFYWLGRHHGPEVTALLGLDLDLAQRWLARASLCALIIVPGAPVCVVAAVASVRWTHFIVADVLATAARAVGLYYTSSALTQPLDMLLAWSLEHGSVALLVTGGVACVTAWPLASRLMRERTVGRPLAVERPQSGSFRWTSEMQDVRDAKS